MTIPLLWGALVAGAVVAGASVVAMLVVPRSAEAPCALLGLAGFAGSSVAFALLSDSYSRLDAVMYGFAFMLAAGAGGYALASTLLYRLNPNEPPSPAPLEQPMAPSGPAAIVFACGEPEHYEPRATAATLQTLTDEELLEASVGALPLLFFAQKTRYRAIGGTSPATQELSQIAEQLEAVLGEKVGGVSWATCQGPGSLQQAVRAAVEAGHHPVVVAELGVAESLSAAAAKRGVDSLRPANVGAEVRYTGSLAGSERIPAMLVERILRATGTSDGAGVVLVGHGQPEDRSRRHPSFDEDETAFLNRLRMLLVDRGLPEHNVRIAWSEWSTPDVTSAVRHIAALGCDRVVVVPAVFPLDTIATRLDLEIAVRQSRVGGSINVVTLPAWRDDAAVIEELRARVNSLLEH